MNQDMRMSKLFGMKEFVRVAEILPEEKIDSKFVIFVYAIDLTSDLVQERILGQLLKVHFALCNSHMWSSLQEEQLKLDRFRGFLLQVYSLIHAVSQLLRYLLVILKEQQLTSDPVLFILSLDNHVAYVCYFLQLFNFELQVVFMIVKSFLVVLNLHTFILLKPL